MDIAKRYLHWILKKKMLLKKLFYHMASYWQLFVYQTRDSTTLTAVWKVFYPYKILSQPTIKNRFEFLGTKTFSKALAKTVFFVGKTKVLKCLNQCFAQLWSYKSVSSKTAVDPASRFCQFETLFPASKSCKTLI